MADQPRRWFARKVKDATHWTEAVDSWEQLLSGCLFDLTEQGSATSLFELEGRTDELVEVAAGLMANGSGTVSPVAMLVISEECVRHAGVEPRSTVGSIPGPMKRMHWELSGLSAGGAVAWAAALYAELRASQGAEGGFGVAGIRPIAVKDAAQMLLAWHESGDFKLKEDRLVRIQKDASR